jgi:hypothetical protein
VPNGNRSRGYPVVWTKAFSGGWTGILGIVDLTGPSRDLTGPSPAVGATRTFIVTASAPAVV